MSLTDGYAWIEELSWNAFNESATLIAVMERYKEQISVYSERGVWRTRYIARGRTSPGARNTAFG